MPIKLVAPEKWRSKNYGIRGTYLGVYVEQSAGTPDKKLAGKKLQKIRREIESGEFSARRGPTFLAWAVNYIEAGGEKRFLGRYDPDTGKWSGLIAHFAETDPHAIDQHALDEAAAVLLPHGTPATRNRQVYTPVSAVLKHGGIDRHFKRPEGSGGAQRTDWLWPEQVFAILGAAKAIDREFAILLYLLNYTGMRLSDALDLACSRTRIAEAFAYLGETKNGLPRGVHLPPVVVAELANHPRGLDRGTEPVFNFRKGARLYDYLDAVLDRARITLPPGVKFHIFCHTWATWMRRYGGVDTRGLVATGRWLDEKSAQRYEHVVVAEEARKADALPTPPLALPAPPIRGEGVAPESQEGHSRAKSAS